MLGLLAVYVFPEKPVRVAIISGSLKTKGVPPVNVLPVTVGFPPDIDEKYPIVQPVIEGEPPETDIALKVQPLTEAEADKAIPSMLLLLTETLLLAIVKYMDPVQ
jgi:hypothetical protein